MSFALPVFVAVFTVLVAVSIFYLFKWQHETDESIWGLRDVSFSDEEITSIRTKMLTVDSFGGVENLAILLSFVETYREQLAALLAASEVARETAQSAVGPAIAEAFIEAREQNLEDGTMTPDGSLLKKAISICDAPKGDSCY